MTYRIERSTNAKGVTFLLSGEMDSDHVTELGALMAASPIASSVSTSPM